MGNNGVWYICRVIYIEADIVYYKSHNSNHEIQLKNEYFILKNMI